ncbi:MAG TPA: hypothetical protein VGL29_21025, partial [Blastocatellia bacterium]
SNEQRRNREACRVGSRGVGTASSAKQLEDVVQNAPGSHRPGKPSIATMQAEREIQALVLGLTNLDRRRQELTVAKSLAE